jgi:6-phosphofructokinase
MNHKPRIGVINGGGDCPGLNTVIDSLVKNLFPEYEILGFYKGYEGLLEKRYFHLLPEFTNQYKFQGGTIPKSSIMVIFQVKLAWETVIKLTPIYYQRPSKTILILD